MSKINGTNLIVMLDTGSGKEEVGFGTDCKLSIEMGTANATTKDSNGWDEIIPTSGKWSIDCNGLVDFHPSAGFHNVADLFTALAGKTPVTVYFQLAAAVEISGDKEYSGVCYITKLEQNAKDKDVMSYSATFEGTGALSQLTH